MPDPFALPDPFAAANAALGISPAERRINQPTLPPLTPEDERSLLEKIGSTIGGGLGLVAGALNKPGRAIRGLLGGTPREALNLIPFSDALGITRPEDEVRGQDLIGAKDADFLSPEGLAGFGVDILTDPLTYLSFGGHALTKAGLAAKRAGTLPATVAERAAQGLGGHVGVGLPFAGNAATFNLAPVGNAIKSGVQTAANVIPGGNAVLEAGGKIGGALGDLYRKTIPPLLESAVMGRKTAAGQAAARDITAGIPAAQAAARQSGMDLAQKAVQFGLEGDEGGRLIRQLGELPDANPLQMAAQMGLGHLSPEQVQAAKEIAGSMTGHLAGNLQQAAELGMPTHALAPSEVLSGPGEGLQRGYLPRQNVLPEPQTFGQFMGRKSVNLEREHARIESLSSHLTTDQLHQIAKDDLGIANSTLNPTEQVQKSIMDKYLGGPKREAEIERLKDLVTQDRLAHQDIITNYEVADQLTNLEATHAALQNQARDLAKMKMAGSLPNFTNHPIVDYTAKVARDNVNFLKAPEAYKALASVATAAGEDTVPIMEPLGKMWKPTETAGESIVDAGGNLVGHTAPMGAQVQMAKALGVSVDELKNIHVPAEVAKDLAGMAKMSTINGLEDFTKVWDSITNLTKAGQTGWPATVVRNMGQDVAQKVIKGAYDPSYSSLNPMRFVAPYQEFKVVANNGTVEGLAKKIPGFESLSDAQAAAKIREEFTAWDVGQNATKRTAMKSGELLDVGNGQAERSLKGLLPVSEQQGPLQAYIGGLKTGSYNPKDLMNVAGVFGKTEDVLAPVKAARSAMNANDNLMRGSTYLAFREQGYTAEEAFKRTMETHFDFGNLTGFERGVMRRVLPFYNWSRQNIPSVVKEIIELPGGKLATAIKATQEAKGEHPGFVRPDIAQGVALPLGGEENGQQRYLSGLGLGFEDLGRLLGPGGVTGQLNPLIKYPLEQATGRQANTGRDIRDIHSRLADLGVNAPQAVENAILNSPVGRVETSLGTLFDPRKGPLEKAVNLLSGARVSDIDVESARRNAVRDYIAQQMHGPGISQFADFSVKPENIPLLTPEQQRLFQLHRVLQSRRPLSTLP